MRGELSGEIAVLMPSRGSKLLPFSLTKIVRKNEYFFKVIGSECAEEYVVAHETGHALGFWHTQLIIILLK